MDSSRERQRERQGARGRGGSEIECVVAPTYPLCDDSLSLTWGYGNLSRNRQILMGGVDGSLGRKDSCDSLFVNGASR